jgi:hypothetical protein
MAKRLFVVWAVVLAVTVTSNEAVANASCPKIGFTVVEPHATPETRSLRVGRNQIIFVRRQPITKTSDISEIKLEGGGDNDDDARLLIKFTPEADQRLHDATTNHSGIRIAFLFNDEVMINIVWQGPYGTELGGGQVDMRHGLNKARELMKAIQGCTAENAGAR